MTVTDTTVLTKPINAMFTRRFLERAAYKTHYFMGSDPAVLTKNAGTATALWRRIEHLTVSTTALSELTGEAYPTRTGVTPTVTDVQKAVSKYGTHILLNEEADVFNFNGTTAELLDVLADNAGRVVNQIVRNEVEDNSTIVYSGTDSGTFGSSDANTGGVVTANALNYIINTLQRNVADTFLAMTRGSVNTGTVPILAAYYGVCHPDVAYDISQISGFTSVEKYAGQVSVMPGEFGYYGLAGTGIRFMATPDASVDAGLGDSGAVAKDNRTTSGDNADLYSTVIYGRHAFGTLGLGKEVPTDAGDVGRKMAVIDIINKPFGSAGTADPLNEYSTLGWKAWCAAKILNTTWIRSLRSAATNLAT
jgi:N4-gp56 family major capsid protein